MKLIAHRGLSSQAPENTIPAFRLAAQNQKYDGIECDVQSTLDRRLVVYHDHNLARLNEVDVEVIKTNYSNLLNYPFKHGNNIHKSNFVFIPLIEEYLHICEQYNKTAVIEIKRIHDEKDIDKLVQTISEFYHLEVTFISFKKAHLLYIKQLRSFELHYLVSYVNEEAISFCLNNQVVLSIPNHLATDELVQSLIKRGLRLAVYTVNDIERINHLESLGVSFITTDI